MYQPGTADAYKLLCEHRPMAFLDRILGRDPARRAAFAAAAAAVDRELAANLELASMFDQTHQVALFEIGEFERHGAALRDDQAVFAAIESVYARVAETEEAMARRGPANTIRPDDVALIERWEGDVRDAQRGLRAAVNAPPPSLWVALIARLRGGRPTGR
jgi:hypothetical protein